MSSASPNPTILIVGASRGLGYAMAAEFLKRGWTVIGTVRTGPRTELHNLAEAHEGRVTIETLDIDQPEQIAALRPPVGPIARHAVRQCRNHHA